MRRDPLPEWVITEVERLRKIEDAALALSGTDPVEWDDEMTLFCRILKDNPRPGS